MIQHASPLLPTPCVSFQTSVERVGVGQLRAYRQAGVDSGRESLPFCSFSPSKVNSGKCLETGMWKAIRKWNKNRFGATLPFTNITTPCGGSRLGSDGLG